MKVTGAPRPPFQMARRALLGSVLVLLAAVAGLYLLGRPTTPGATDGDEASSDPLAAEREPDAVLWSEGFQYEQRVGERSAFELRGDRFATDREGVTTLEGVGLELTRENGDHYLIESRNATYDSRSGEARLSGDVRLAGKRDFRLESDRIDLVDRGRTVVSRGPVRFASGQLTGRASGMRLEIENDRFLLRGNVRASGSESPGRAPLSLHAASVVLDRTANLLRASGGVELGSGADSLRAEEIDLELTEDDGNARAAVARGGVTGRIAPESGESAVDSPVDFSGATGRVAFAGDPARPAALELEGDGKSPARLTSREGAGPLRSLAAPSLSATLVDGRPATAVARGGVVLLEEAGSGRAPAREARAREASATFGPAGALESVALQGDVVLREPKFEATGERGNYDFGDGSGWLVAAKGERAHARSERGELEAPRLELERQGGVVKGRQGAVAVLQPGAGGPRIGPSGEESREPIRVEAKDAELAEGSGLWAFRGDVRAVQGRSLLFADELSGSDRDGTANGVGSVRTVWEETPSGGEPARPPITISAARVAYRRDPGEIVYSGNVSARQEDRELSSDTVTVELDERQRARRMTATGQVRLQDRKQGRTVTGSSAVHDLEARTILVEGDPVLLAEREGTKVRGRRLLYELEAGTARMLAENEAL